MSSSDMYRQLFKAILGRVTLTGEELDLLKTYFIPKKLRKRQYLIQEGDLVKFTAFVEKGILRSFAVDERGNEHILQFALEGWWTGDLDSYLNQEPAMVHVEALEDAELLLLTLDAANEMMEKIPSMQRYFLLLAQKNMVAMQKRLVATLSLTAEDRYKRMTQLYPTIVQRVPQHMIASYLGITPETLSRVRKQMVSQK